MFLRDYLSDFKAKGNLPKIPNSTTVTEFLLTRFSDVWDFRVLHAVLFLLMYLATLGGNLLIVKMITFIWKLNTPMYFFLRNLSVLDMCYISVMVPKACVIFLLDHMAISMARCVAQIFLVTAFATVELLFLTIMARDHYVAICQPLQYFLVMNPWFCVQMTLASVFSGLAYSGFQTGNIFWLPFCQSNVVHQFFCDTPSLLKLSYSDILNNEIFIFISSVVIAGGCFAFITMSYIFIFSTVFKFPTRTFATCVPHILMVTIFVSSAAAVYVKPTSSSPTIQDMITSVFYYIVPPFLNPIIYSLRNKQIKEAVKRVMGRKLYSGKS